MNFTCISYFAKANIVTDVMYKKHKKHTLHLLYLNSGSNGSMNPSHEINWGLF